MGRINLVRKAGLTLEKHRHWLTNTTGSANNADFGIVLGASSCITSSVRGLVCGATRNDMLFGRKEQLELLRSAKMRCACAREMRATESDRAREEAERWKRRAGACGGPRGGDGGGSDGHSGGCSLRHTHILWIRAVPRSTRHSTAVRAAVCRVRAIRAVCVYGSCMQGARH